MVHKQDVAHLKQLARGRWPEVLSELGGVDAELFDGKHHPCPKCGGKDRFRFIDKDDGILFCNRCFSSDNGDGLAALMWLNGWNFTETLDKLAEWLGVSGSGNSTPKPKTSTKEVAWYDYRDESGELLFQKVRYEPKDFRQRAPKPGGGWNYSLKDVRKVLYRLPELLEAGPEETIFMLEGEKDVDRLHGLGLVATCNFDGAGKWLDDYTESLVDKNVVILPDNDDGGQSHGELVASKLQGRAASIRVVELPDLPEKGDVSDWLDAGGTVEELMEIVKEAEPWEPSQDGNHQEPFPMDALPEVVQCYVEEASDALGCDPAFVAVPLLAVLAAAIGDSCVIELKATWQEPPILWAAIIAPSASQKTPAMKMAIDPLAPINREGFQNHEAAMQEFERDMLIYESDLALWRKTGRKNDDPPPEKPKKPGCKRYIVSDITLEALADRLSENPHGLLVMVDELAGWIGSLDAYTKSNKDEAGWLSLHSGAPLTVDRKTGKPTIYIERPTVSIVGGIQPGVFAKLFSGNAGKRKTQSGMTQRLLICEPTLRPKVWSERDISEPTKKAMFEVVKNLVDLSPNISPDGDRDPYHIVMDHEAKATWKRFFNDHNDETYKSTGAIRAHWGKLEAYAARLALILHLVEFADREDAPAKINAQTLTAGIRLCRWFGSEAQRIYADILMVDGGVDTKERDLVEWIEKRGGSTTVRDLKRGPREYREKGKAESALNDLAKKQIGFWEVDSHDGGKGRPSRLFTLGDGDSGDKNSLTAEKKGFSSPSPPDEKRKTTTTPVDGESGGGLLI